jgi:hypothetical protein
MQVRSACEHVGAGLCCNPDKNMSAVCCVCQCCFGRSGVWHGLHLAVGGCSRMTGMLNCHQRIVCPQGSLSSGTAAAPSCTHQGCFQCGEDELILPRFGTECDLLKYRGTFDGCCLGLTQQLCTCCPAVVSKGNHNLNWLLFTLGGILCNQMAQTSDQSRCWIRSGYLVSVHQFKSTARNLGLLKLEVLTVV